MRETSTHFYFWGTWFSQWAKGHFSVDGVEYNCAEQYMMAEKARVFKDEEILKKILKSSNPKEQKSLGRKIKNYKDEIWNEKRYKIVVKGNLAKFSQIEEAKKFLEKTGNKILVEGSPLDRIWGVGLHYKDNKILDENNWRGKNLLGKALMEVRKEIFKKREDNE